LTCDDAARRLTAYVDGDLDDATQRAVRGHLRSCEACRTAAADELAVRDAMTRLPAPEVPPALWESISAQLAAGEVADSKRSRWWLWWQIARPKLLPAGLVAAAAALALVTWLRRDHGDEAARAPQVAEAAPAPAAVTGPATPGAPVPAAAVAIEDPSGPPSLRRDCKVHAASAGAAATDRVAALAAAIDRCYGVAVDELLAIVALDRPGWSAERAAVFDAELDTARHAVTTAGAGRPRERAWQAVIQLLQRAVTVPMVAAVTP
jgi:hypothetical protein